MKALILPAPKQPFPSKFSFLCSLDPSALRRLKDNWLLKAKKDKKSQSKYKRVIPIKQRESEPEHYTGLSRGLEGLEVATYGGNERGGAREGTSGVTRHV